MQINTSIFKHHLWRKISSFLFLLGTLGSLNAQVTVSGRITNGGDGAPLVGARIVEIGAARGALTDTKGDFSFRSAQNPPFSVMVTYFGFDTVRYEIASANEEVRVALNEIQVSANEVTITASASIERARQSPLSVESMSINAIKETPAANFYDGLGSMKEVDLTAASIGFKVINTRGFNSAAPIRSLQIIDGVDNQSPGLNFSLGNFLGASELDVQQVDLIIGAASAYYGPNAFNGVISMTTKDPFVHRGLSAMLRVGERNLVEGAIRYARAFTNKDGEDKFAFKLSAYYLSVNDWEADNLDPVDQEVVGRNNPGGYDAVNRYGDEDPGGGSYNAVGTNDQVINPGLGRVRRTGYEEVDMVDYDTRNLKLHMALHYKFTPKVELIGATSYAQGTTVLQGDNRYSLRNVQFFQHRLELRQRDKFFIRGYVTHEDAGDSYDAVFTALRLQDNLKSEDRWITDYRNFWAGLPPGNPYYQPPTNGISGMRGRVRNLPGFPAQTFPYDFATADSVLAANSGLLQEWHDLAREYADDFEFPRYEVGTQRFDSAFNHITTTPISEGGTRLVSRSALYHLHGEYKFDIGETWHFTIGGNGRIFTPISDGNLFSDTLTVDIRNENGVQVRDTSFRRITNIEGGVYAGLEKTIFSDKVKLNATARLDKNQNFPVVSSYALSAVWQINERHLVRASLASAVRNPTLTDQYLYYNVGRAILIGNLDGFNQLADTASLQRYFDSPVKDSAIIDYYNVDPIRPERVQMIELGYRGRFFRDRLYVDASWYFNRYRDFIGFNIGAEVSFSTLPPFFLSGLQVYRIAANARDIVTTQGASIRLDYFFDGGYTLSGNYSWNRLNSASDDPIIPAYNTPEHKFNISFSGRDVTWGNLRHMGFGINYKWIEGYLFEGSPQFTGSIPTYDLLDVQINKYFPKIKTTFKLGASNVLNNKVFQIYGGPRVGRLIYFTALLDLNNL